MPHTRKGASIKYVRTEEGGVQKSANFADKPSYRSADKEGVQKSENFADVLNGSPPSSEEGGK